MAKLIKKRKELFNEFQQRIGYSFENDELLNRAFTHSSFANEHKRQNLSNNERLEFLGDSVLSVVVSDYIFEKYPNYPEGELTKLRATVVCEPSLAIIAKKLNLGIYLLLGKGEEATGGRERVSIVADAVEAVIGAIYLDGGLINARKFILSIFTAIIDEAVKGKLFIDYKTELQEVLQRTTKAKIRYTVINEDGPDHNKIFQIGVKVGNKLLGEGMGKSKKEAEQNAAKSALSDLGVINE
ncbi:ribonuclease III [Sporosalibacterium faouarense]|uniref:ribonuclease III n=1 Tax=Sporosalibacterium faouarense TaxID=516123 RepID=UPI00141C6D58|nr:ribonuclease III [Sporosalibacterium faouarense]MTI47693.1 ribonuclease III [Bacillota bacterium]